MLSNTDFSIIMLRLNSFVINYNLRNNSHSFPRFFKQLKGDINNYRFSAYFTELFSFMN